MERHNRKSHLNFPQISPASKALLRGENVSDVSGIAPSREKRREKPAPISSQVPTPTSGDIPITRDSISGPGANGRSAVPTPVTASRPAYPTRTSSASQVPQHSHHSSHSSQSSQGHQMNLPIRPAPQVSSRPTSRPSSRRPDTADRALLDQQRDQQLLQQQRDRERDLLVQRELQQRDQQLRDQQAYSSRRPMNRSGYSDPRLGAGYSSLPGSRDGYSTTSSAGSSSRGGDANQGYQEARSTTPQSADERTPRYETHGQSQREGGTTPRYPTADGNTPNARNFYDKF